MPSAGHGLHLNDDYVIYDYIQSLTGLMIIQQFAMIQHKRRELIKILPIMDIAVIMTCVIDYRWVHIL